MYRDKNRHTHLWFRLNAWGALVAVLAILGAVDWMMSPDCVTPPCTRLPLVGWTVYSCYLVAGVLLLVSYWTLIVRLELVASVLLLAANILFTVRTWVFADEGERGTFEVYVTVLIAATVILRFTALWQGGNFTLPSWRLGGPPQPPDDDVVAET